MTNINKNSLSGVIRRFSFWLANGTLSHPLLIDIKYAENLLEEPSAMEMIYAIFINNLEFDKNGDVTNAKYAEKRAAIFIKQYFGGDNSENLEDWETELH